LKGWTYVKRDKERDGEIESANVGYRKVRDRKDWIEPGLEMEKRESKYCTWKERAIIWRLEERDPALDMEKREIIGWRGGDRLKMRKKQCARR
jgi:hypothetical protein